MVWIGDFFGSIADSPSSLFSIAWGGVNTTSSLQDKDYRLIKDDHVILSGRTPNRIGSAKVEDNGSFIIDTITATNNSILLAFDVDGTQIFKKGARSYVGYFGLTPDSAYILWLVKGDLHILNRQQGSVRIIHTPNIFHATGVNYIAAEAIVLIQHAAREWYRFSLTGQFLDAEKWTRDQETENIKAQQGVAPYSAQGALSGER
ncbi:hypothetical protein EOM57_04240 [Candidatus Saccharibacteria bacterium]|nr:hypothetical protein [Candidatus Saccharibacteria bacterium]